jgi:hypothetical protein
VKTFSIAEPCETRPIRFIELAEFSGWTIKVYGIAYQRPQPRPDVLTAAMDLAKAAFPQPPEAQGRYGVGFMGVHDGRGVNFVFCDWWADENELHHRVFVSPHDRPHNFEDMTATGPTACVWDLRVLCFERQAWLDKVLRNPRGPDINAYLETTLREDA